MRVAIIGGGPAGMLAAYGAAQCGAEAELFEKNEKLGKKLFITGKGRCNITNSRDIEEFFENIPTNPKFLYSALYTLPNDALLGMLEENGLETKVERGGRVFPASDKSSDVIRTLERMLKKSGVTIHLNSRIDGLHIKAGVCRGVRISGRTLPFDRVILATGGISYPATGSTGDGHAFAREAGHTVTLLEPSLIPLVVRQAELVRALAGLSLKNVRLTLRIRGKKAFEEQGELLFTHFGISGPLALSASAHLRQKEMAHTQVVLDLKPALSLEKLDARILRDFSEMHGKRLKNALVKLLPGNMQSAVIQMAGLDGEKPVSGLTKEDRHALGAAIKGFTLDIVGTRDVAEAIVTRGGVHVREVDPGTMESRRVRGLYFAGELLDVDAYTGGFNLQIAWSTGYLAGLSSAD